MQYVEPPIANNHEEAYKSLRVLIGDLSCTKNSENDSYIPYLVCIAKDETDISV